MPARARYTRSLTLRMTDDDLAPVEARADALDIPTSQALRELVHMGAWLDRAQRIGVVVTPAAAALLADGQGANVGFGYGPDDEWLDRLERDLGESGIASARAGAALLYAREEAP